MNLFRSKYRCCSKNCQYTNRKINKMGIYSNDRIKQPLSLKHMHTHNFLYDTNVNMQLDIPTYPFQHAQVTEASVQNKQTNNSLIPLYFQGPYDKKSPCLTHLQLFVFPKIFSTWRSPNLSAICEDFLGFFDREVSGGSPTVRLGQNDQIFVSEKQGHLCVVGPTSQSLILG